MEMRVDRLREALNLLQPFVPKKSTLPVLNNILLKDGRAEATDLETSVALELPEADGQCLVPCRTVADLLKRVPGYETLTVEQKGKSLNLTWPGGKASYEVPAPKDYPPFPKVESKTRQLVDGDTLVAALSSIVGYCATKDDRPVLNGVTVYLGERLEAMAGDGFRMAYQSMPIAFPVEAVDSVIIPARSIVLLKHLWDKTPRAPTGSSLVELVTAKKQLELALGDKMLEARLQRATIVVKLIEGTPPVWRQLIPSETRPEVKMLAPEFERAVRRVQDAASDGGGIIRLSWSEVAMTLSAKGEVNQVETTVAVEAQEPGKVAVNVNYLLEYLRGKEGLVTMGVISPQQPVIFRYDASPLVIVMPMFVEW